MTAYSWTDLILAAVACSWGVGVLVGLVAACVTRRGGHYY